jgi:uncharacterized membrane-anchored protein
MRKFIVVATALAVLAVVNFNIYAREKLLNEGRTLLLELAPVDPRSLMQGDYMALRYRVADDAFAGRRPEELKDGKMIVTLDQRGVASFARLASAAPLAANEALLRYRVRDGQPKFASDAFFFQEGQAEAYQQARYGEYRVAANGDMILTAMRGADFGLLGQPSVSTRRQSQPNGR